MQYWLELAVNQELQVQLVQLDHQVALVLQVLQD
jgi:hypothetical protein